MQFQLRSFRMAAALFGALLPVYAQSSTPATVDPAYLVRYAANLNVGESYIDIVNTVLNGDPFLGPGFGSGALGNICVNVYAMSTDEQMAACCSCLITANQVVSLGVNSSLLQRTLTGATETALTIKLIGSNAGATSCANSAAAVTAANMLTGGFTAFGTTLHALPAPGSYATTETPFAPAQFATGGLPGANDELHSLTAGCAAILGNGSTHGICAGCKAATAGAVKQQ